jgi:hypothetical protein
MDLFNPFSELCTPEQYVPPDYTFTGSKGKVPKKDGIRRVPADPVLKVGVNQPKYSHASYLIQRFVDEAHVLLLPRPKKKQPELQYLFAHDHDQRGRRRQRLDGSSIYQRLRLMFLPPYSALGVSLPRSLAGSPQNTLKDWLNLVSP